MWLEEYKNKGLAKSTSVRARSMSLKKWLCYFDDIQLKKIDMKSIQTALNELNEKHSLNYMRSILEVIKMVFKKAKELGYINTLPTEFVYIPKLRKRIDELESEEITLKYLEKDVLQQFLNVAKDHGIDYDYLLFKLLAYSGLRIGEALGLKWTDIDFEKQSITINRRLIHFGNVPDRYEIDTPKTKTSKREILLDKSLISNLKEWRTQQAWFRSKHPETVDHGFVFINLNSKKGYPQTQANARDRIERIRRISNIEQPITPHTFRHTHTSLLAEAGVDLNTIMERLGHKNDSITREIYLHITKSLKQEAVVKFAKLMDEM
jgi:integrase